MSAPIKIDSRASDVANQLANSLAQLDAWLNNLGTRHDIFIDNPNAPSKLIIGINVNDLGRYIINEATKRVKHAVPRSEVGVITYKGDAWLKLIIYLNVNGSGGGDGSGK